MANIAIFRINYKSDFILTLNSDAGWMTPFCIKFWTGAPSQAYFVGFDGTTYTHCAPVDGEPTKLLVQFDDHHLPIGDLKFQIGYHFTVADFPTSIEDEVINQAAVIIDNDGEQQQVMLDFNGETAPEIEFSLPAYANEAQRIANEAQRIANEEQRIATETQRIANEEQRISQEQTRQQNEVQRIVQEQARVTAERERFNDYAKLKVDAIAATDAANSAADLANEKAQLAADNAQLAADKAALAQSASALATEKAQLATDKAALAQSAATLANEKAALAQQKAEYATAQGDYAKAQGDYAKAQAGVIPTDVTCTQTDATFVNGNHDPLFYLRQANSSLAGLMTAAGYTKLNDMPSAQEVNAGLAYDVSVLHPTSGVNGGSTYASLSAALAVIPQEKRNGGMTVKFVQSSDNKYVQYFLTKNQWSASVADWEKMNLEEEVSQLDQRFHSPDTEVGTFDNGYFNTNADTLPASRNNLNGCKSAKISVTPGQLYKIYGEALNNNYYRFYAFYDVDGNRIDRYASSGIYRDTPLNVTVPTSATTMVVNLGNYAVATDKVLVPGEEYSFGKVYQDLGETNEEIEDVANSLIDHYRVELKGNSGSNLILPNPISLSQNGDSLEISVNIIASSTVSGTRCYGLSSNGEASAGYISVGAAWNRICVRAVDGTWIYDRAIVTGATIKVKILYDDGKILVYLNDSLITTYNGQKEIKITSFGNGANGSYGYWAGYINYCKVNGQYYDFSKATANDAVVSPVEKYATLQQATMRGVLKYDSTNKAFTFFSQVAGNKYASFRVELNQNDSDLVYLKEWRLSTAKMCEYDGFDFAEVAEILYDAENEMAMRFSGAADFTGGIHGDERIDVSPDSFVRFFAGGRLITDEEMASDFSVICDSFSYDQYSTLHQTSATEGEYVAGHPIVATHYKRNTFENGASHLVNIVKMVGTQNVTVFHAGMVGVGKGAGKYVILPIGVLSQELDGTKPDTYANHPTPGTAKFWNPVTGVSAIVEGKFIEGYNNDTDVITSDTTHGFYVWDRATDSKYYRRNLSTKQFQDGAVIINEQVIQYSV